MVEEHGIEKARKQMQIVINISKDDFEEICIQSRMVEDTGSLFGRIRKAISHGTPFPKGHKVIDAWALQEHLALVPIEDRTYREAVEIIDKFPPITETDEEVEE